MLIVSTEYKNKKIHYAPQRFMSLCGVEKRQPYTWMSIALFRDDVNCKTCLKLMKGNK